MNTFFTTQDMSYTPEIIIGLILYNSYGIIFHHSGILVNKKCYGTVLCTVTQYSNSSKEWKFGGKNEILKEQLLYGRTVKMESKENLTSEEWATKLCKSKFLNTVQINFPDSRYNCQEFENNSALSVLCSYTLAYVLSTENDFKCLQCLSVREIFTEALLESQSPEFCLS